jgi:uncharacterized SAM-binding protein YcdF (DUF218 family)
VRRAFKRTAVAGALLAGLWLSLLAAQIVAEGEPGQSGRADVAVVLGAAVYGDRPSPVFEERIKHAISLYRTGKTRMLLFTGGYGDGARHAEATVGRRYAIARGVPRHAMLTETLSRTTRGNLVQAHRLMRDNGLKTALIVSDPLHMKRAMRMASDLRIRAAAAPTPTSRYRSWRSKAGFLLRELYFYNHYLVTGQ